MGAIIGSGRGARVVAAGGFDLQALVGLVLRALNLKTEIFYRVVFLLKSE